MRKVNMNSIRSIERAIDILLAFSQKKTATTQEIAEMTNIPHSTVYRILCTLEGKNMVQFNEKTAKYKPGLKLFEFNSLLPYVLDVRQDAEDLLDELHFKTGQTTNMAVRDADQIIYIYKKEKSEGLKFTTVVGQRRPFVYGVLGPVLLAFLPDNQIKEILDSPISERTPSSIIDKKSILQRLQQIKKEKIYIDSDGTGIGVTGIGTPLFNTDGEVIAAIGVIGPSAQMSDQLEKIKTLILETSSNISSKMGYRG